MNSRYRVFCTVVEMGSFTKAANELGYTQSAVSQMVKALEAELNITLIERSKEGLSLTKDGEQIYPYIEDIYSAEKALEEKEQEMRGMGNSRISIGTFTSVSRTFLPKLMKEFQDEHPGVSFELLQGEYNSIDQWVKNGTVDFGFVNPDVIPQAATNIIYRDHMVAVLRPGHPLANKKKVSLRDLVNEPYIQLDEGESSVAMDAFHRYNLTPNWKYRVYDDYSIISMVRQGLGFSLLFDAVVEGFETDLVVKEIEEPVERSIALHWRNRKTMSYASATFVKKIMEYCEKEKV